MKLRTVLAATAAVGLWVLGPIVFGDLAGVPPAPAPEPEVHFGAPSTGHVVVGTPTNSSAVQWNNTSGSSCWRWANPEHTTIADTGISCGGGGESCGGMHEGVCR